MGLTDRTWVKWRGVNLQTERLRPHCRTWHLKRVTDGGLISSFTACGREIGLDPKEYSCPVYPPGGPDSCCGQCLAVMESKGKQNG